MAFIRGSFALCPSCSAELGVQGNVVKIIPGLDDKRYVAQCACGRQSTHVVTLELHEAAIQYLHQVAQASKNRETIEVPVSVEEVSLLEFAGLLDQVGSVEDLTKMWE